MAICDHLFNGTGLNKVGTALRTFRLNILAHMPDPKCPEYGPKWAKKSPKQAENSYLATQIGWKAYFELDGVEQG